MFNLGEAEEELPAGLQTVDRLDGLVNLVVKALQGEHEQREASETRYKISPESPAGWQTDGHHCLGAELVTCQESQA